MTILWFVTIENYQWPRNVCQSCQNYLFIGKAQAQNGVYRSHLHLKDSSLCSMSADGVREFMNKPSQCRWQSDLHFCTWEFILLSLESCSKHTPQFVNNSSFRYLKQELAVTSDWLIGRPKGMWSLKRHKKKKNKYRHFELFFFSVFVQVYHGKR